MEEEFVKWKTYILGAIVLNPIIYGNISKDVIETNMDRLVDDVYGLILHIADKAKNRDTRTDELNISISFTMQECMTIRF